MKNLLTIQYLKLQGFGSYRKRKNLTQRIRDNFQNIQLRPEAFHDYLVHEVAFSVGETIAVPHHSAQGFQRPLQVCYSRLTLKKLSLDCK